MKKIFLINIIFLIIISIYCEDEKIIEPNSVFSEDNEAISDKPIEKEKSITNETLNNIPEDNLTNPNEKKENQINDNQDKNNETLKTKKKKRKRRKYYK